MDGIDEIRGIDRGVHRLAVAVEGAAHSLELIAESLASIDETLTAFLESKKASKGAKDECRLADTPREVQ